MIFYHFSKYLYYYYPLITFYKNDNYIISNEEIKLKSKISKGITHVNKIWRSRIDNKEIKDRLKTSNSLTKNNEDNYFFYDNYRINIPIEKLLYINDNFER